MTASVLEWLLPLATAVVVLVHVAVVGSILFAERRQPSATLAWLLSVIALPGIGVVLWFLIGATRARRLLARSRDVRGRIRGVLAECRPALDAARAEAGVRGTPAEKLIELGWRSGEAPASRGNVVELLVDAPVTYRAMIDAIHQARQHVHVLFYIIQPDLTGRSLRERLVEKARDGVQVRLLVDPVGSQALPGDFWRPLEEEGGEVAAFNPLRWRHRRAAARDRLDFRNHRKILVVDGRVGFTGGINVGKEYLGLDPEIGHWRDAHLRIEGPAALALQAVFARDWALSTGELCDAAAWFPPAQAAATPGSLVQIVDSGPDSEWSPVERLVLQALAEARDRAWFATPYFVPGESLQEAMISAALRGVDLRLLVPERSDSTIVTLAARTYYGDILAAGARIWEYRRGFLHAKTMVVDDWVGTVGSANLDLRSFRLNFELNAFVYDAEFCHSLAELFERDLGQARELRLEDLARRPIAMRLASRLARLVSPLL